MKTLAIKQPWAWLIIHGGKDIENRTWNTKYRGPLLIHSSARPVAGAQDLIDEIRSRGLADVPDVKDLLYGGIIGMVKLVDVVTESRSIWFQGPYGFVLEEGSPVTFYPVVGRLGFFDVSMVTKSRKGDRN